MILALILAATAILAGACALAARAFPEPRGLGDRAAATGVVATAMTIACVRILSPLHQLVPAAMTVALVLAGGGALTLAGGAARRQARCDARGAVALFGRALCAETAAPLAWLGLAAMTCAAVAAWRFSPWAWDALGYHLPIVNDAIATHGMRVVPTNIPYVNAYPRAVETFFIAVRLLLGDDTWLDFAQAPFGVLACVVVAALARRLGAPSARAAAFGLATLAVPLVMLQLATDYVDVAVASLLGAAAYFAASPRLSRADLALWALATGLFLGSKPSAPPVTVVLCAVVLVRAVRGQRGVFALGACAAVAVLGGETYLANVIAHGNPIWPIALDAGPLHLPGEDSATPLFVQGLPPGLAHASWATRVATSLFVEPQAYIYDMRLGGLGPLAALGLVPLALVAIGRAPRATWGAVLLIGCALATPAAHWMRYALALPIALMALASVALIGKRGVVAADLALVVLAVIGLGHALPGLSAGSTGIDGREALWNAVRAEVAPGEAFAYDASFSLPGQLTCGDGRNAASVYLGNEPSVEGIDRAIHAGHARVVIAGDGSLTAKAIARSRDEYALAFRCPLDACDVFVRLEPESRSASR